MANERAGKADENLDVDGLAKIIHRTPKAIYRMVARRQLPYRKHGARLLFRRSEIEQLIENLPGVTLIEVIGESNG